MTKLTLLLRSAFNFQKKSVKGPNTSNGLLIKTSNRIRHIEVISPYELNGNGDLTPPFKPFASSSENQSSAFKN